MATGGPGSGALRRPGSRQRSSRRLRISSSPRGYVGDRGWVGVRIVHDDGRTPDWDEIHELVVEAYRCVAPARLVRLLEDR
jgi:hypothetical protein